jgi:DNA-binding protein YbaB
LDANAWLQDYQQQAQARVARAGEIKEQLASASASAQSPDGAVTVTVGPSGALQNVEFSPRAEGLSRTQLAQVILRTAREAHRRVAERMAQAVKPLIGDSEAMEFLESQVPPPEMAQPSSRPAPRGDAEPGFGSILR